MSAKHSTQLLTDIIERVNLVRGPDKSGAGSASQNGGGFYKWLLRLTTPSGKNTPVGCCARSWKTPNIGRKNERR